MRAGYSRRRSTLPVVSAPEPVLSVDELNQFLADAFDSQRPYRVESVVPGSVEVSMEADALALRPGDTVAGPSLMMLADASAYAVVLAHIGRVALAVTSNLDINFLRKTPRARLTARAELLKLGRRLALTDVRITTTAHDELVAQATVTYAIPSNDRAAGS
jgi:uncharacterized protein (TIGR00369 family)